jgi:hypothetical protein
MHRSGAGCCDADVARGYSDVAAPSQLGVWSQRWRGSGLIDSRNLTAVRSTLTARLATVVKLEQRPMNRRVWNGGESERSSVSRGDKPAAASRIGRVFSVLNWLDTVQVQGDS